MKTAELSEIQRKVYEYIRSSMIQNGYPPTVREIGSAVGISSPSVVYAHLHRLEEANLIIQGKGHRRAIRLTDPLGTTASATSSAKFSAKPIPSSTTEAPKIPLLRSETVSVHSFSQKDVLEYLPSSLPFSQAEPIFALKMPDEALVDAGILQGDVVIIREGESAADGEFAAVRLEGRWTVRRWKVRRGEVWLFTDNPEYPACRAEGVEVCGRVVWLLRNFATRGRGAPPRP